ncbi:complex I subunit 5 family protein [Phytoactinopolyspora mesophila]|uniref:Monovalent cation/H+ antiporter subunit D family protein n=1 Tax=Phytoactinopolyspora mesophila TaxID=2650750 RepID=A0A7K3M4H3_9ACTN|nr:proton-conducting transporter membrane subunit [Phytoactinopolyspora mesophila]NDL57937.1 monovalent cation/H+ antiporter subunit D family protein [Phytoactinopolyspora mesophila]
MNADVIQPGHIVVPLMLLTSLLPGIVIFFLREEQVQLRTTLNMAGAIAKVGLTASLIPPVVAGIRLEWRLPILPGIDLVLVTDPLSLFFVALSSGLWLLTTIYAISYLEGSPNRSRFFGFFSLCVTATTGIALSGNLLTFLLFYEMLTLVTYPLVAHRGTGKALDAARTYLVYTLSGGVVLLLGVAWLTWLVGPVEFTAGGADQVAELVAERPAVATAVFAILIAGLAVKSALIPLHGWLPKAMIAPAPVSALLHAVAVVKAGAFGIFRVIHDVFGVSRAMELGVLTPLAAIASITIVYGSVRALTQDGLKERLAYSTVSQLSYIALGASVIGQVATTGGVVHLVHQGFMKITLFFCAGIFAETLKVTKVSELAGMGRRMPLTSLAFTVAAFGMIGLPPMAGFVSKWYLGLGGLEAGEPWVIGILVTSTLLNAAYFLPAVISMWLRHPGRSAEWAPESPGGFFEAPKALLFPTLVTALLALLMGMLAGIPYSPLSIAELIAEGSYPFR